MLRWIQKIVTPAICTSTLTSMNVAPGSHVHGSQCRGADRGCHDLLDPAQHERDAGGLRARPRLSASLPVLRRALAVYQLKLGDVGNRHTKVCARHGAALKGSVCRAHASAWGPELT